MKKQLSLRLIIATFICRLACTFAQECVPAPAGLAGWWSFEPSSVYELPAGLSVGDSSGFLNTGTGSGLKSTAGLVGSAFEFNGSSSVITVPPAAALNVKSLTFAAWINPADGNSRPIMEYGDDWVGVLFWVNVGFNYTAPGNLAANVREGVGLEHTLTAQNAVPLNEWSFVALTYDYATGLGRLYVNGRIVQESYLGSFVPMTGGTLNIGQRPVINHDGWGYPGTHFLGKMDEVQVYDRALSQSEIAALHAAGSAGLCNDRPGSVPAEDGLVAYYPLDGTAVDLSANHLDGRVVSATLATDRFGRTNGAMHFNGVSDYVDFGNPVAFNFEGNFTLNAWVQQSVPSPRTYLLGKYFSTGPFDNASHSYGLGTDEAGSPYGFVLGDGVFYNEVRTSTNLADGQWHALSLVYNDAFGVTLYMDGQALASAFVPELRAFTNSYPLLLGRIASGQFFQGNLDEVSIYNRALNDNEIAALYQRQDAGSLIRLQNATATFSQTVGDDFSVAHAIDGTSADNFGWAIYPEIGKQTAVFETQSDVGFQSGTRLVFNLQFRHKSVPGSTGHALGKFRISLTTDDRKSFADGVASGGKVEANWIPVEILSLHSESGAVLTPLPDGAILASGDLRESDAYTVEIGTRLTGITGVRLEALTDASLPFGGPGREPLNGNFVLSELTVSAKPGLAPEIVAQPGSLTVIAGAIATFNVVATNSVPPTYQWFLNGARIIGATNSSFTVERASSQDAGTYRVAVSSAEGTTTSRGAVLTVEPADSGNAGALLVSNRAPNPAPIFDERGNPLADARYLVQVYASSSGTAFQAVSPAVPFLNGTNAGYFAPIRAFISAVRPGDPVEVKLVAWDSQFGASYEEAALNGGARGSSPSISTLTGGGNLPIPQVRGLSSFSLTRPPSIISQPESKSVYVGENLDFQVQASGSIPLQFQWRFNSNDIIGATSATLHLENVQLSQAGEYSAVVFSGQGAATSEIARLTVNLRDLTPPEITISAPLSGTTFASVISLRGRVTDNVEVSTVSWSLNGELHGVLPLENGEFTQTNIFLARGTNVLRVIATDSSGNESSASVSVVLQVSRNLAVGTVPSYQEGALVSVPIELKSGGDVSGLTFTLGYDRNYLENPVVVWGDNLQGAFVQVNTNTGGIIRASFALSGTALTSGTQIVANVHFHARSVPSSLRVPLQLSVVGISSPSGESLSTGTDVASGGVNLLKRRYKGDNNANDRLDVGDASAIMRLLNLVEMPRSWDVSANDLNQNLQLDVGDVIRVLRAVIGLDSQPGESALKKQSAWLNSAAAGPTAVMRLDKATAGAGEKVKVTIELEDIGSSTSGASFLLRYQPEALRLETAEAHRIGAIVPSNAIVLWNVMPNQNDYAAQNGKVALAVSTDISWPAAGGVLAEFSFTVQPGATNRYQWPIELSALELSRGYELSDGNDVTVQFQGRAPQPASIHANYQLSTGEFNLVVSGEGTRFRIEASQDLKRWAEVGVYDGTVLVPVTFRPGADSDARFFRAVLLQ